MVKRHKPADAQCRRIGDVLPGKPVDPSRKRRIVDHLLDEYPEIVLDGLGVNFAPSSIHLRIQVKIGRSVSTLMEGEVW